MRPRADVNVRNSALLDWYDTNRRPLPWRETRDPYPILVSEMMLQQTQVSRVVPRFESFMRRFPSVDELAAATPDDVLGEWVGLGYNSRALRLRLAAVEIADSGWPTTSADLCALPGIGPYTAAAIASMAFGELVPAVDTNLRRVLGRWAGEALDGRPLAEYAREVVGDPAGEWNQALMDLGSQLCRPSTPDCARCPVSAWCSDPDVYAPPRPHGRFEGSTRQLRGALVRAHLDGEDLRSVGRSLGRSPQEVSEVIQALVDEGLVANQP